MQQQQEHLLLIRIAKKQIEQDFWMSILLDVGIGLEINVLTSKFILLGDQMLGEMGCHPEICFYLVLLIQSKAIQIKWMIHLSYFLSDSKKKFFKRAKNIKTKVQN